MPQSYLHKTLLMEASYTNTGEGAFRSCYTELKVQAKSNILAQDIF